MRCRGLQRCGDLAGGDLQGREQGRGAVPDVVVGAALDQPGLHRQHRHGPVQRLDLGLLVHAEHDRVLRRVQVQAHDVDDLPYQLGVGGEPERLRSPRLDPVGTPRLCDRVVADPELPGQQPARPVRHPELLRRRRQRRGHDRALVDRARPPRPRLVLQPGDALAPGTAPPPDHRRPRDDPDQLGDPVFATPSAASSTIRARCAEPARTRREPHQPLQLAPITIAQHQRRSSTIRHAS